MNNLSLYDELDHAIDQIIAHPDGTPASTQPAIAELLDVASDLRHLPRPDFKMRLRVELQWQAMGNKVIKDQDVSPAGKPQLVQTDILPTLFGKGYGTYPVRRSNFALSLAVHAVALLVVGAMSLWIVEHSARKTVGGATIVSLIVPHLEPVGSKPSGGGGGGGDAGKLPASHGLVPQIARKQITPPAVAITNVQPKPAVAPTIVADLKVPPASQVGDPLSRLATPSNGPGVRSGIGSGSGGGIGSGNGVGTGKGSDAGFGGGVYRVGNGVTAPRVIYSPDPDYSDEARKAKYQGVVTLWAIITPDGHPINIRVARSLGMGLDEKAVETVRHWRFEPGKKDGVAVPVVINVEVDFHLY